MLFIIVSCKKLDSDIRKKPFVDKAKEFLTVPASTSPTIKRIAETIKKQNEQTHFLDWFADKFGYAIWNKPHLFLPKGNAQGRTNHVPDTLAFIPLVNEGVDEVHSFLGCEIKEDSVKIRLFRSDRYAAYGKNFQLDSLSSETVALECMVLENRIFGHDVFRINVLGLFKDSPTDTSKSRFLFIKDFVDSSKQKSMPHTSGRTSDYYVPMWSTYCVTIGVQGYPSPGGGSPPPPSQYAAHSYEVTSCYNVLTWVNIIEGPLEPGGSSGTIGTGGGGGSPWYEEDPCRTALPGQCGDDMTEGWVYVGEAAQTSNYNVLWCDTIGYSNSLQSMYPCAYYLIHDSLPNVNYLAQLAGTNVFEDSTYMHLTFDTSTTFTTAIDAAGETNASPNIYIDDNGFTHFRATIKLNGWYLRNATKEYKIKVIVHECMHAIFTLRWGQYLRWLNFQQGNIDSFFIKQHFPIHWYYITQQNVPLTELQDHEIMATDYVNFFTSIVGQFYNPSAPSAIKDTVLKAMGYGGLDKTTAWKLLPSMGIDTCKYKNIIMTAAQSLIGQYSTPGCPTFTANYLDSLKLTTGCH